MTETNGTVIATAIKPVAAFFAPTTMQSPPSTRNSSSTAPNASCGTSNSTGLVKRFNLASLRWDVSNGRGVANFVYDALARRPNGKEVTSALAPV